MHLLTFNKHGTPTIGIRQGDTIIDLSIAKPDAPKDMCALLAAGVDALKGLQAPKEAIIMAESVDYLPPVTKPEKILCVGLNYRDHAAEGNMPIPDYPVFFARFAHTLVGHKQPIIRPKASEKLDYEGELAIIIGKKARHVSKDKALSVVAGYSIFHDATLRDYQVKTPQWTVGKNFDSTGGFGPHIVTADELPEGGHGLRIKTRLNGETMQDSTTAEFIFDTATIISTLSEVMTLQPGDVIITGTPAGVGFARKPPRWMKAGDICEIDIEGIGTLTNPIRDEA